MATFPVVLDACVIYPASLRDILLHAADQDLYRVHWSQSILDEATRNLIDDRRMDPAKARYLIEQMTLAFPGAQVDPPMTLIEGMTNDPGDRHVAATAVAAHAQVVVTFNLKHFPSEALAPWSLEVQHPDEFLRHLLWLSPSAMLEALFQQAEQLRNPPRTVPEVLQTLRQHAPEFVAEIIRQHPNLAGVTGA